MLSFLERKRGISLIITLAIAIIIFYISSLTFEPASGAGGFGMKTVIYHIIIFFTFTLFLLISLLQGNLKKTEIIFGIIFAFIYALSDEFHQHFVPSRAMSLIDIFYDSFGIIFATTIYLSLIKYRSIKNSLNNFKNK